MRYPGHGSKDLPPLPNSVIDSSGLHDYPGNNNCVTNTQQEQPSTDYQWTGATHKDNPVALIPDQWVKSLLGPYQLWLAKITVTRPALYQFNLTFIEGGQSIAVFGRHLDYPSVTKHDWVEYVLGENRRFSSEAHPVTASLTEGTWYVAIYNDGDTELEFGLVLSYLNTGAECYNNCGDHGTCVAGKCQCDSQWTGEDCSTSLCPVLCSGHGHYGGGHCHCEQGWKGEECNVRHDECEMADCSGHGDCSAGVCQCHSGWTGPNCDQRKLLLFSPQILIFELFTALSTFLC